MTFEEAVGQVIQKERKRQELSIRTLCKRMGNKPEPGNLSRLENGKGGSPTLRTIGRICIGLGLPPHRLFHRAWRLMSAESARLAVELEQRWAPWGSYDASSGA